ncbi:hypothetical protein HDU93_003603, partial [Gonapodya sp. JEL0774]
TIVYYTVSTARTTGSTTSRKTTGTGTGTGTSTDDGTGEPTADPNALSQNAPATAPPSSGLSVGAIAGIGAGGIAVGLVILGALIMGYRRHRDRDEPPFEPMAPSLSRKRSSPSQKMYAQSYNNGPNGSFREWGPGSDQGNSGYLSNMDSMRSDLSYESTGGPPMPMRNVAPQQSMGYGATSYEMSAIMPPGPSAQYNSQYNAAQPSGPLGPMPNVQGPPPTTFISPYFLNQGGDPSSTEGQDVGKNMEAKAGYEKQNPDEIDVAGGDGIYVQRVFPDGWAVGTNLRSNQTGFFPMAVMDSPAGPTAGSINVASSIRTASVQFPISQVQQMMTSSVIGSSLA